MVGILHEFVLGYVTDNKGTVKDLRVYNLSTAKVTEVPVQMDGYYLNLSSRKDSHFLNLSIYKGILTPKFCGPLAMPRIHNGEVKGSNAWVLYAYEDGRLVLLSVTGQMKTVTEETAMSYHSRYGIVGCFIRQDGTFSVPSYAKRMKSEIDLDADATRSILTLKYGLGADFDSLFIKACRDCDEELVKQLLVSGNVNLQSRNKLVLTIACSRDSAEILRELLVAVPPLDDAKLSTCIKMAESQSSMSALNLLYEYEYRLELEKQLKLAEPALRKMQLFDREAAKAIIALKYPIGTDMEQVLFDASESGDIDMVKLLLVAEQVSIQAKNNKALKLACEQGHTEVVGLLLTNGADIHVDADYAIEAASLKGHLGVVSLLLEHGASVVNSKALSLASEYGQTGVVALILDTCAGLQSRCSVALGYASANGHKDIVELLLARGAYVHDAGDVALRIACTNGHSEVIELLLANGADIHAQEDFALRQACKHEHVEVVKLLLAKGADVHAKNDAAMRHATEYGHTEVVELLQSHINSTGMDKEAAKAIIALKYPPDADLKSLFYAACSSGDAESVNILGSSGLIDIHAGGDFAFRTACSNGNIESVALLAAMGADIHAQNEYALRWSCNGGHMEVVKFLLDRGADIHALDEAPLVGAITYGKADVVKLLLDSGADIHATDERALRMACSEGHLDTVRLLLERGADVHAKEDKALFTAASLGRADIVELLLAYGADASARGDAALYKAQAEEHDAVVALLEAALKANESAK